VAGYPEVWERFVRERRLEFGGYTDPGWRKGHAVSASLMIPVEASRFGERLEP
jgi:2'-5' RNA ligase